MSAPPSARSATSAREARRPLGAVPFMAFLVFSGIVSVRHHGLAWAGWLMIVGGVTAIVGAVMTVARRRPVRDREHGFAVLLGVDVMGALLALAREEVGWPIRIVVCAVLLTATLALYLDQRQSERVAGAA